MKIHSFPLFRPLFQTNEPGIVIIISNETKKVGKDELMKRILRIFKTEIEDKQRRTWNRGIYSHLSSGHQKTRDRKHRTHDTYRNMLFGFLRKFKLGMRLSWDLKCIQSQIIYSISQPKVEKQNFLVIISPINQESLRQIRRVLSPPLNSGSVLRLHKKKTPEMIGDFIGKAFRTTFVNWQQVQNSWRHIIFLLVSILVLTTCFSSKNTNCESRNGALW